MTMITNKAGIFIEDGTPYEITWSGAEVDFIDYTVGADVFRETYTYTDGKITSVTIPTLQVLP